jgi:O-phospho-L-seryl-tRNASec:L-selenocysteinyl-tRNA synthase
VFWRRLPDLCSNIFAPLSSPCFVSGIVPQEKMNESNIELAAGLVPTQFLKNGVNGARKLEKKVGLLLSSRKMPERGWSDNEIEAFLGQLGAMDSNNFAVGVGEREGRVVNAIVARRCFGMSHGMGRSGNLSGAQPKVGSRLFHFFPLVVG